MLVATTYMVIKQSLVLKITLFSLGLARSPMATSSCRQSGVVFFKTNAWIGHFSFLWKSEKTFLLVFQKLFPKAAMATYFCQGRVDFEVTRPDWRAASKSL